MSSLKVKVKDGVVTLTLARAKARNAFNAEMITELTEKLHELSSDHSIRILILAAEGQTFCAGADANWMKSQKDVSETDNLADAEKIFDMFRAAYEFPHPIIARVQGGAYGGGAGLICCSDIVVMADDAQTAFSEVRLGVVPATISVFVLRKIGEGRARELFLTGRRISAQECLQFGLATEVVPEDKLDEAVEKWTDELLKAAPTAQTVAKNLLSVLPRMTLDEARRFTPMRIAKQRVSPEGQEGLAALLEKRAPNWSPQK
jgi:methylglutaconyl-CoA hydratase